VVGVQCGPRAKEGSQQMVWSLRLRACCCCCCRRVDHQQLLAHTCTQTTTGVLACLDGYMNIAMEQTEVRVCFVPWKAQQAPRRVKQLFCLVCCCRRMQTFSPSLTPLSPFRSNHTPHRSTSMGSSRTSTATLSFGGTTCCTSAPSNSSFGCSCCACLFFNVYDLSCNVSNLVLLMLDPIAVLCADQSQHTHADASKTAGGEYMTNAREHRTTQLKPASLTSRVAFPTIDSLPYHSKHIKTAAPDQTWPSPRQSRNQSSKKPVQRRTQSMSVPFAL